MMELNLDRKFVFELVGLKQGSIKIQRTKDEGDNNWDLNLKNQPQKITECEFTTCSNVSPPQSSASFNVFIAVLCGMPLA